MSDPRVSVVIPTYDQSDLLVGTLRNLTRQNLATESFEVIVADDGSSDETRAVVESFSESLRLGYHFQEDLGFRVATARNAGAALASAPVLVFLDTGSMVGPDFLARHLAAHADDQPRQAVVGYCYGYNPETPMQGVDELLERMRPEEIVARHKDLPEFQDIRYAEYVKCGFDLNRRAAPWMLFWTGNCSVRTEDFRQLGGFDETFNGWGGEDMELGYRLHGAGIPFRLDASAWAVFAPHDRDVDANDEAFNRNMTRFLAKTPEPVVEIVWGNTQNPISLWETDCQAFFAWSEKAAGLDVSDEIARMTEGRVREGERIAVIGCGGRVPVSLSPATLLDFDARLLGQAVRTGGHVGQHAIGIRTPLADGQFDAVFITSRLAGLWETWGEAIQAEADRIGRRTYLFQSSSGEATDRARILK